MKDSEIINYILSHYEISPSELARRLGLKRAQNVYDIQSGKTGISKKNAELICNKFPDLNVNWWGSGNKFKEVSLKDQSVSDPEPIYNCKNCEKLQKEISLKDSEINRLKSMLFDLREMNPGIFIPSNDKEKDTG